MELIFEDDPFAMNWLRPDYPYAEVRMSPGHIADTGVEGLPVTTKVSTVRDGDLLRTDIEITNCGSTPLFLRDGDIGVTLPLEDRYDLGADQVTKRCNVHVYCGGTTSYVIARRMGGAGPHLGLALTEGALSSYSIERNLDSSSNDRGCFILNIAPMELGVGQTARVAWCVFPLNDPDAFHAEAAHWADTVHADWDRYVLFLNEHATLTITPSFSSRSVTVNGDAVTRDSGGSYRFEFTANELGEHVFDIDADGRTSRTRILVKVPFAQLVENRCRFIADRQQYQGPILGLTGAFLVYDNEDDRVFYNAANDVNAGRERVGMGVLLALYLIALRDGRIAAADADTHERIRGSLDEFTRFMRRELVDPADGRAFNDFGRDGSFPRLYNAPWYAAFFVKLYELDGESDDLVTAVRIIRRYYEEGGADFYPLELPIVALCGALDRAQMTAELAEVTALFRVHSERIVQLGTAYPPSEVNYEQSIVVPGIEVLLQTFMVTGDAGLLDAAGEHVQAMLQFQGTQPDYHLNEVAIRHWDGYWFGKRAQFGDTFPHYWSGLTGNAFAHLFEITGNPHYADRARRSLRGILSMIFDDGRASCAYVFPLTVNGVRTHGFDPYANDQDWGLVFALRQLVDRPEDPLL